MRVFFVKTRQEISAKQDFAAAPADAVAFRGLDPAEQHQNDNDDQNRADKTDASMTETVSIAAEAAAESAKQKDDQDNYKNKSQDMVSSPFACLNENYFARRT